MTNRVDRTLPGALLVLVAIGVGTYVVFSVRGDEPSRMWMWLLLPWIGSLAAVMAAIGWRDKHDADTKRR